MSANTPLSPSARHQSAVSPSKNGKPHSSLLALLNKDTRTPLSPSKTNVPSRANNISAVLMEMPFPSLPFKAPVPTAAEKPAPAVVQATAHLPEIKRQRVDSPSPAAVAESAAVPEAAPAFEDIPTKTAARTVYDTPELRRRIFEHATQRTLARVLRCEKAVTASVAEILYGTIDIQRIGKMSRMNERRATYCDAVRVIDRNALPTHEVFPHNRKRGQSDPHGPHRVRFNAEDVISKVEGWRKKYPNLQKVLWYEHPSNHLEDAYVIHIRGDAIHVDLQAVVQLDSRVPPSSPSFNAAALFKKPSYRGLTIDKYTIAVHATGYQLEDKECWQNWLYANPTMDKRVTSIFSSAPMIPSLDKVISTLRQRRSRRCEPLTAFYLPSDSQEQTIPADRFRELLAALGPEIRTFHIRESLLSEFEDGGEVLALIDEAFPNLRTLHFEYESYYSRFSEDGRLEFDQTSVPSARRFMNLRLLHFWPDLPNHEHGQSDHYGDARNHMDVIRNMWRIGHKDCVFLNGNLKHVWQVKEFNDLIKKIKHKPSIAKGMTHACQEKEKVSNGWNPGWRGRGFW